MQQIEADGAGGGSGRITCQSPHHMEGRESESEEALPIQVPVAVESEGQTDLNIVPSEAGDRISEAASDDCMAHQTEGLMIEIHLEYL